MKKLQSAVARKAGLARGGTDTEEFKQAASELAFLQAQRDLSPRLPLLNAEHKAELIRSIQGDA